MMWHGPTRCRQNGRDKAWIELSREAVWLSNVERAAILQVIRDAGRPKRVASNLDLKARIPGPPPNHAPGILGGHGILGERLCPPDGDAKERALAVLGNLGRLDV